MTDDKLAEEVESRNRAYVERDDLRARVAELESMLKHYERETAALRNECDGLCCPKTEAAEARVAELERERDTLLNERATLRAAVASNIRERDEARSSRDALAAEAERLRALVAEFGEYGSCDVSCSFRPSCICGWVKTYERIQAALAAPSSAAAVLSARDKRLKAQWDADFTAAWDADHPKTEDDEAAERDAAFDEHVALIDLLNGDREDPAASAALAERDERVRADQDTHWRILMKSFPVGGESYPSDLNACAIDARDERVRRVALEEGENELAKLLGVHLFSEIDVTMTQRQVVQMCINQLRALATPAPATPCCPRKPGQPHWGGCPTWSAPATPKEET